MKSSVLALICAAAFCGAANAVRPDAQKKWALFVENSSVLSLAAGQATMKSVMETFGEQKIPTPGGSHGLVRLCYKNADASVHAVFLTGYLHDYDHMAGFELYANPLKPRDTDCKVSDRLSQPLATPGGVSLGMKHSKLLGLLSKPARQRRKDLIWQFKHHEVYSQPKILRQLAGPTNEKYTLQTTVKGAFHDATLTARFSAGKLSRFQVFSGGESDFELKNLPLD